jgi:hypothetical protein
VQFYNFQILEFPILDFRHSTLEIRGSELYFIKFHIRDRFGIDISTVSRNYLFENPSSKFNNTIKFHRNPKYNLIQTNPHEKRLSFLLLIDKKNVANLEGQKKGANNNIRKIGFFQQIRFSPSFLSIIP